MHTANTVMPDVGVVMDFFAGVTVSDIVFWAIAISLLVYGIRKAWPGLKAFVRAVDLLTHLEGRLTAIDERTERIRAQVENSHTTNLREESDARHIEVMNAISEVKDDIVGVKGDIVGVRKDVGRLDSRDLLHSEHHVQVDAKLTHLNDVVDEHLEWSRAYVKQANQGEK